MNRVSAISVSLLLVVGVVGCAKNVEDQQKSIEDQQMDACTADIKRNLNDPNSLEVLSFETHERDDKTFLLILDYTAKNKLGGRVRDSASCGFKTKNDTTLNPDEFQNQMRNLGL